MYMWKRGERGVSSWSTVGVCFQCEGFVWAWEVSPYFLQGVDVYVLCVCVRTRTHTACGVLGCEPWSQDETPGEPRRNPDVLSDSIHIYHTVYEVHMHIYTLGYR